MTHAPSIHVLVVASDPVRRAEVCVRLGARGFAVTAVPDGPSALARMETTRFDVVVEDGMGTEPRAPSIQRAIDGGAPVLAIQGGPFADIVERVARLAGAADERATRTTQVPKFTRSSGRTVRLLLLDDSEVTLELTQTALVQAGFDVRIAAAESEALAIAAAWRPDVAVIDLRRPEASDRPLCAQLKEQGVTLTLVASSLTDAELLRASREAFADGYVSKAKGVRGFVARIEELVARSLGGQA